MTNTTNVSLMKSRKVHMIYNYLFSENELNMWLCMNFKHVIYDVKPHTHSTTEVHQLNQSTST